MMVGFGPSDGPPEHAPPAPPPPPRLALPHRYDLGSEWSALLAEVDLRCGPDVARRIDAIARAAAKDETP